MNKLIKIQDILFDEIEKLNTINDEYVLENEMQKSNAISKGATAFIKSVNTSLKIKEMAVDTDTQTEQDILLDTGIIDVVDYK